jgi:ferric-dicitrate binding protein FerR (iron transport regulator)
MNPQQRRGEMTGCSDFQGPLAAAVYGALDEAERKALDEHLRGCADCRRERDELTRAAQAVGRGEGKLGPGERAAVKAGIERKIAALRPKTRRAYVVRSRRPLLAWAAAAAVFVAAISAVLFLKKPEPIPDVVVEVPGPKPAPRIEAPVPKTEPPAVPKVEPPVAPKPAPQPPVEPPAPKPETPKPEPPRPEPEPPKPVEAPKPPPVEKPTIAVLATVDSVRGTAGLKVGQDLLAGQELRVAGRVGFRYPDGTRVEIGPETMVRLAGKGKAIFVAHGTLNATVVKQPAGQPMLIASPHSEAAVLGTTLSVRVAADSTRLEVQEGRVRFTRLEDKASVEVATGHQALAMKGKPLASRFGRVTTGLQALYLFDEGKGGTVYDVGGTGAPLDLELRRPKSVPWSPAGMTFNSATYAASAGPATKLIEACRQTGEVTLEAWVQPAAAAPRFEGVIVGLSQDRSERNLTLMQGEGADLSVYAISLRTTQTDAGGNPILASPKGTAVAAHVVYTRSAAGLEKLFVNGVERASKVRKGDLSNWSDAYRLVLGGEPTEERPWLGELRFVAIYNRALAPVDVVRNFKVGGDER